MKSSNEEFLYTLNEKSLSVCLGTQSFIVIIFQFSFLFLSLFLSFYYVAAFQVFEVSTNLTAE